MVGANLLRLIPSECPARSFDDGETIVRSEVFWYKGNLHMHSLWSDGDDLPELIAARFKEAGYHFIAFTEHDRFQEGEPPVLGTRRIEHLDPSKFSLKRLSEYRQTVEEPGRFLILNGEEVSVRCGDRRHWINVINAPEPLGPIVYDGDTSQAIRSVVTRAEQLGHGSLVSFNHPNYLWNGTAEDLAESRVLRFFEIHTALNCTYSYGDERRVGAERMWDIALSLRLLGQEGQSLFGLATDDCHGYRSVDAGPCRAWVMVRAPELTPDALISSMSRGDFYCSTGVTLGWLEAGPHEIYLRIEETEGVSYTTRFIGTRQGVDLMSTPTLDENGLPLHTTKRYTNDIGVILKETVGPEATYTFAGDEIYVRALIVSNCPHPCPTVSGDVLKAWTQPVCSGAL